MSREDSGVIDLFAMHKKATESAAQSVVPPDIFSAPPPAFSTDLAGDRLSGMGDGENPFAKKPRKNLYIAGGIAGGLLFIGILVASFTGGSPEPAKASASGRSEPTTVSAPAPPPPPAQIVIAPVTPTEAPAASAKVPAPPTTGAAILQKPPAKAGRAAAPTKRAPATTAGGVKLTKVQSAGVARQ